MIYYVGCKEGDTLKEEKEARYQMIAYQIAKQIVAGELKLNEKISGRSVLAGEFNVSSETIRKSMRLLSNLGAVKVEPRSGIYVESKEAASLFIEQYKKQREDHRLLEKTYDLIEESKDLQNKIEKQIEKLVNTSKKDVFPFEYFVIDIPSKGNHLGETLYDLDFWKNTRGLLIAAEVDGVFTQAPNPDLLLEPGMKLYILGDENVKQKTLTFFNIE